MPNYSLTDELLLGKATDYPEQYSADHLQAVPRALGRTDLGIDQKNSHLPFLGYDQWTAFELSWLNPKGVPQVAIAEVCVPVTSPHLIESKSFKLYLNSFNQHALASWPALTHLLQQDLSRCAGAEVQVQLYSLTEYAQRGIALPRGENIDQQDIYIDNYQYDARLLRANSQLQVTETLYSDLLKSNCLITNQPDWASIEIHYQGAQIDRASLLRYLVSFRNHNEFHEQCVERIFIDLMQQVQPELLSVQARYTRRGGLDINPWRTSSLNIQPLTRMVRQ